MVSRAPGRVARSTGNQERGETVLRRFAAAAPQELAAPIPEVKERDRRRRAPPARLRDGVLASIPFAPHLERVTIHPGAVRPLGAGAAKKRPLGTGWGMRRRRRADVAAGPVGLPAGPAMWILAALWVLTLYDPQWWLARHGLGVLLRLPVLLFVALGLAFGLTTLVSQEVQRRWIWYWPFLAYIAVMGVTVPFAINAGYAFVGFRTMLLFWTLIVSTSLLVDTAKRAELLLVAFLLQYLWWGVWGFPIGLVAWHPALANFDTFGSLMVIGAGLCAFMVLATDDKRFKRLMAGTVALCVIGVVASFARGAFLSAIAVAIVVWLRSPKKGKTLAAGIGCAILVSIAASILFGEEYWKEMSTILEGTGESTGEDRVEMWKAAFGVFLEHPFVGVGFDNWGIFASQFYIPGELGGKYADNPGRLYGISAHSTYVTTLAEHGTAGVLSLIWILVDFWKRNAYLRTRAAAERWRQLGGRFRLRPVALGIEAAMVAWMATASLYTMQGLHWLYTLLALNLLFHTLVTSPPAGGAPAGRRLRRSRPTAAAVASPASAPSSAPRG